MNFETRRSREVTMKEKLLALVRQYPGMEGTDNRIPKGYRRFLRILEREGKIFFKAGWHVTVGV